MKEYKDTLGRVIELGDIVVCDKSDYKGLETGIVIGYTPMKIKTSIGHHEPKNTMVVTEQFYASGKSDLVDEFRSKYADKLDPTKPRTTITKKWRYNAFVVKCGKSNPDEYVLVVKCEASSYSTMRESVRGAFDLHGVDDSGYGYRKTLIPEWKNRGFTGKFKFEKSYNYYEKGLPLRTITTCGLEKYINTLIPIDQFKVEFPDISMV